MTVQQVPIQPLYKKENGMFVVDVMNVTFPSEEKFPERVAITIPPNIIAGNHSHERVEALISLSENVQFFWRDASGAIQTLPMYKKGQLFLTVVPSFIPHAVWNTNKKDPAFLLEFTNGVSGPVEQTILIEH